MAANRNRRRRKPGRPQNIERELTTVGSQLISWALPGKQTNNFEMASPDDLLGRKGFDIYAEMASDDQIKACLWYKKTLIVERPWEIVREGDSEQDKKAAEFIQKNFEYINIKQVMFDMLSAFEWGFSAGEIIWTIDDRFGDLMLRLDDVKFRDPEYMFIETDKSGNIKRFIQKPSQFTRSGGGPDANRIEVPPEKILHYAYQGDFSNHLGVSDMRGVYRAWWSKKYITQFFNIFLERFGAPLMSMTYPAGSSTELKNDLKSIMNGLSSKTDILIPEGVNIELIEATRAGTARYEEALTHYDIRIAAGLLVPALLGQGTDIKRGSDSQSRLHLRTLLKYLNFVASQIICEVQQKIIDPIVDANFNVKESPKLKFRDYGEFESFEVTSAITELFNAGILDPDGKDVNFARGLLGLDLRDEDNEDEVIRSQPPPLGTSPNDPNATGDGAQQGNDRAQKSPSTRKTDPNTGQRR